MMYYCAIDTTLAIRLGFELPGYTYTEPQYEEFIDEFFQSPTSRPENGPIYLVKENNVLSEQTFYISMQVTDSAPSGVSIQSATLRQDYNFRFGTSSQTELFLPLQWRIAVRFELLADTLPEGTEVFQASFSPEGTQPLGGGMVERFPISLYPINLTSEIFITIVDNDRKF